MVRVFFINPPFIKYISRRNKRQEKKTYNKIEFASKILKAFENKQGDVNVHV